MAVNRAPLSPISHFGRSVKFISPFLKLTQNPPIIGCLKKGCEFSLDFLPQVSYDFSGLKKERFLDRPRRIGVLSLTI